MLLVPQPSRVGRNLTATRRWVSTTPAKPSDGRSGYCAPPASRQLPGNQHGKTKEERRRREHITGRQARRPSRGSWNVTPEAWKNSLGKVGLRGALACWHSGLWVVAQVRFCSDTEPLVELLQVARHNSWCSKPSATAKAPLVTTRHDSGHNRGYDCQNNTTVWRRPEAVEWAPLV